jgi:hypothetical protein
MNVVCPEDEVVPHLRGNPAVASADAEILAMVVRADADFEAGRFVTVSASVDAEALHEATLARLRARITADRSRRERVAHASKN